MDHFWWRDRAKPASQEHGDTISKVFVIQQICHVAIQESDKLSCLTGRTHSVTKKLVDTICDVGHPHEMTFVEPTHVFLDEMVGNCDDHLVFQL